MRQTDFRVIPAQPYCHIGRNHLVLCDRVPAENAGDTGRAGYPNGQNRCERKCSYAGITSHRPRKFMCLI